jgi:hypothetical protein
MLKDLKPLVIGLYPGFHFGQHILFNFLLSGSYFSFHLLEIGVCRCLLAFVSVRSLYITASSILMETISCSIFFFISVADDTNIYYRLQSNNSIQSQFWHQTVTEWGELYEGFELDDWIYCTFYIHTLKTTDNYAVIAIPPTLQFTVAHALGLSVFTNGILTADLSVSL